ncbi:hypothetical protein [uncultured Thiocystis sp.]|uniref:hypothetical protein n=1 Tax=uncultured Thiocystis sp. TaxID=1202134 RepID=UPI0025EE180E|nr:hypothetical protein [uncultured Thiocystis sp.]
MTLPLGVGHSVAYPLAGAVLNLNLPGLSGATLAHELRRLAPTLPLVIVTGRSETDWTRYGAPPPGTRRLKKPFDLDALEDALFLLLD